MSDLLIWWWPTKCCQYYM